MFSTSSSSSSAKIMAGPPFPPPPPFPPRPPPLPPDPTIYQMIQHILARLTHVDRSLGKLVGQVHTLQGKVNLLLNDNRVDYSPRDEDPSDEPSDNPMDDSSGDEPDD